MAKRYEVGGFGDLTGPSRRQAPQRLNFLPRNSKCTCLGQVSDKNEDYVSTM